VGCGEYVTTTDLPASRGEPDLRRADYDDEWGYEVWSLLCTTCSFQWYGAAWDTCPRCIKALEAEHGRFDEYQATAPDIPPPPLDDEIAGYDETLAGMLVDWAEFWQQDHHDAEWLAEPLIAAHRSTAIFAPGGTGKSLLALYISARLATGTTVFGHHVEPIDVLYLDYEMTADDLAERLEQMGFDESADLSKLHYALLPSLPGLDEPEGGKAVVRLAEMVQAELVVIDTFGRAVHGDENDADTVRSWYRWTGIHLKHAGRAFLRVDHAGKDVTKGQRGTSAKNDDVDVVWQMAANEGGAFTLSAKKRRMGWVPMSVDVVLVEDPWMSFQLAEGPVVPAGTKEAIKLMDALDIPTTASAAVAIKALRAAGHKCRNEVGRAAQKSRSGRLGVPENAGRGAGRGALGEGRGAVRGAVQTEDAKALVDDLGRDLGRGGARGSDVSGARCASQRGAHAPNVAHDDIQEPVENSQAIDISSLEF
jgi:hypothetical protein